MKNNICISKRQFILAIVTVCIATYMLLSQSILRKKNAITSRAAPQDIIGGRDAKPGEYPFVALLDGGGCTGVLIDKKWILTAAHCVRMREDHFVSLNTIERDINKVHKNNIFKTILKVVHPKSKFGGAEYKEGDIDNDIALLMLEKEINHIDPVSLPQSDSYYQIGQIISQVGYGCVGLSPTPGATPDYENPNYLEYPTDKLKTIEMPILNINSGSNQTEFDIGYIDNRAIMNNICHGDSGGPSLIKIGNSYILLGVLSKGYQTSYDTPTKVYSYIGWIKDIIANPPPFPTSTPTPTPPISCKMLDGSGKYYPIVSSLNTVTDSEYFIFQDCLYNASSKKLTGYECYHNMPFFSTPHAILLASKNKNCYVPNLTDCLEKNDRKANDDSKCIVTQKPLIIVKYGDIYKETSSLTYKCMCTEKYMYPILVQISPTPNTLDISK